MAVRKIGKKKDHPRRIIQSANGKGAMATELREGADTALRLLQDIKAKRIDPRDLEASQRRACLLLLANGTQTSAEMAAMFGVASSTIRKDLKKIREELGREVKQWTLEEVLGDLALTADKCSANAMRQEDPGLSWTIKRDFAKILKEFGVIGPQEEKNSLTVTLQGIGEGYERARAALVKGLDPRLTGEVIDVEGEVKEGGDHPPPLPLDRRLTDMAAQAEEEETESRPDEPSSVDLLDDDEDELV